MAIHQLCLMCTRLTFYMSHHGSTYKMTHKMVLCVMFITREILLLLRTWSETRCVGLCQQGRSHSDVATTLPIEERCGLPVRWRSDICRTDIGQPPRHHHLGTLLPNCNMCCLYCLYCLCCVLLRDHHKFFSSSLSVVAFRHQSRQAWKGNTLSYEKSPSDHCHFQEPERKCGD